MTLPKFVPVNGPMPETLFTNPPGIAPRPFAIFPPNSNIMGFDFNYNPRFGREGDIYIASFGPIESNMPGGNLRTGVGHNIITVDINNGQISTFLMNKSGFAASEGDGGLGRPTDVKFGPDGAMYISDYSMTTIDNMGVNYPNTGVIWRVSRI